MAGKKSKSQPKIFNRQDLEPASSLDDENEESRDFEEIIPSHRLDQVDSDSDNDNDDKGEDNKSFDGISDDNKMKSTSNKDLPTDDS
mmetsp:Transcript_31793/g.63009  ORF Transcript_31793/g.63009 Transcript_31793/m.63009 type:complete len:87 (-) Transcript_31793:180-440(-)|eukprot:CAMPEP_0194333018 /NCGR_PEP_ID=MMETSP0171-20130528/61312_1 /TAXON_ID=218684 /ORGANISM="Corethron pennatum, Strain L29A3" /LENGTH=86 /DNA_ID=CAMNT_0039095111 /DNA_START=124 /DNA_END=384 /DNA_ORIENTATION=+